MLTRIAIAALAVALLTAGAGAVTSPKRVSAEPQPSRSTVVEKNQLWPVKGLITVEPCAVRACQEA